MHMTNGRGLQVGRGDTRPLGFYGVGRLAECSPAGVDEYDAPCVYFPADATPPKPTGTSPTFVPNPGGSYYDPLTGFTINPKTGTITGTTPTPKPKASAGIDTSYLLIAVGVVGLLIMMKR